MAAKTAEDYIWNMLKSKHYVLNRADIFSENLQEATHTMAPTNMSDNLKIYLFFPINALN